MKGNVLKLIVFFLALLFTFFFSNCEKKDGTKPLDGIAVFIMEYDCQSGYHIFADTSNIAQTFREANTELSIFFDALYLYPEEVNYESLGYYLFQHFTTIGSPPDQQLRYKSYIIAIKDAYNKPVEPGDQIMLGQTSAGGDEGFAHSVIFVQSIKDNYDPPDEENMLAKTPIHEMGHLRAGLPELCNEDGSFNPEHNEFDCVMGQGKIAICTGYDVATNPHFCSSCIQKLKEIKW